jgi:hypothetical protein
MEAPVSVSNVYGDSPCGRYVFLPGGLALPVEPCLLALDLERRGIRLTRDGEDIVIEPRELLTDGDRRQLRLWKRHVLALLAYEPPEIQ